MNSLKYIAYTTMTLLFIASNGLCRAQSTKKLSFQAALQTSFSKKTGDAAEHIRMRSDGTDTLWGLDSKYRTPLGFGYGVEFGMEYNVTPFFFLGGGIALRNQSIRDSRTIKYDPPIGGLAEDELEILDQMIYFSPRINIGGRWRWISLMAGAEINFYVDARTKSIYRSANTSGSVEESETVVKTTTWDQPIYTDPSAAGGIQNYTVATGKNHGLNPKYLNPFVELRLAVPNRENSPFLGFRYSFNGTAYRRSNNPQYSLVNSFNPGTLEELNLSSKVRSFTILAGWTF